MKKRIKKLIIKGKSDEEIIKIMSTEEPKEKQSFTVTKSFEIIEATKGEETIHIPTLNNEDYITEVLPSEGYTIGERIMVEAIEGGENKIVYAGESSWNEYMFEWQPGIMIYMSLGNYNELVEGGYITSEEAPKEESKDVALESIAKELDELILTNKPRADKELFKYRGTHVEDGKITVYYTLGRELRHPDEYEDTSEEWKAEINKAEQAEQAVNQAIKEIEKKHDVKIEYGGGY